MAKKDTWMPLDVGAYLADTMRLTTQQHGAYFLLLCDYWKTGPLPDDDAQLAGVAKVELKDWKSRVGPAIRRFFFTGPDGMLHQKRADIEIEKTGRITDARRKAAFGRHGTPSDSLPPDKQTECKTDANEMQNEMQTDVQTDEKSDAKEVQNPLRARPGRGHALAPPLPRTLSKQPSSETQSPREAPTAVNGHHWRANPEHNGPEPGSGRELCGGWYWDEVWPRIVEAAQIDPARFLGTEIPAREWLREDIEPEVIVRVIERMMKRPPAGGVGSLNFFSKQIRAAGRIKP